MESAATILAWLITAYLGLGVLMAPWLAFKGINRIDPDAANGSIGFRLIVLPSMVLMWAVLIRRVLRAQEAPTERTNHKIKTAGS